MYTKYFGLKEKPFSIAPDPRYLYMSELHREALAHLLYGISGDGCFILLTGDVGTGKTTVCRCLLAQLPENTDVALIVNPRLSALELLETVCDEFKIPIEENEKSLKTYIDKLNVYLLAAHAKGRNVALLIDEAQNLSLDLLEQLRLLTNLETDQKKLLKIVLLGQTELREILNREDAAQINQRITSRYHLLPLDKENTANYINHRLGVAGEANLIFSKSALESVYEHSCGIPRLINVLCDRSLLGTYVEEKYLVSKGVVKKAAREVLGGVERKKTGQQKGQQTLIIVLLVLLFLMGVGTVSYYSASQSRVAGRIDPVSVEEAVGVQQVDMQSGNFKKAHELTNELPVVEPETQKQVKKKKRVRIRIARLEISD